MSAIASPSSSEKENFFSFVDILQQWTGKQRHKMAWAQLDDRGEVIKSVTYGTLVEQACNIARNMKTSEHAVKGGDRILLIFPPSLDFIVAFVACLIGGFIAVPAFPPDPTKSGNRDLHGLCAIKNSSGAKIALTTSLYHNMIKLNELKLLVTGASSSWPEIQWIKTDALPAFSRSPLTDNGVYAVYTGAVSTDIAFLQYTSGSTSEPKGVMISHSNLLHNLQLIIDGLAATEDTVVVSWLPQYHDMGLIGSYLGAVFCGGCGYYMTPFSFIRNPSLWIQCISQYRGTHMQAPNFAYSLTARKFLAKCQNSNSVELEKLTNIDLSCVRHMIDAAEPVEASSIELFHAVFGQYGLPSGVVFPTYGLAEHSVYVCSNGKQIISVDKHDMETNKVITVFNTSGIGEQELERMATESTAKTRGNDDSRDTSSERVIMVGCGYPAASANLNLLIVDPDTEVSLPEDCVGEVWINSPSKAQGYWGLEEKSQCDFNAKLKTGGGVDDTVAAIVVATQSSCGESDGFLRTGDLGFLHKGELFICGRIKDLLIIRGRNHYPQDIERSCEGVTVAGNRLALRGGCSAAFGLSIAGIECVILVAELTDSYKGFTQYEEKTFVSQLLSTVAANHGVQLSAISLCCPRSVTKTSSGKIARQWVKKAYLECTLPTEITWSNLDSSTGAESAVDTTGRSGLSFAEKSMRDDMSPEAMDPTGQTMATVQAALVGVLSECMGSHVDSSTLNENTRVVSLGLDSMSLIKMQGLMDTRFTVSLPDEILAEEEATIGTLAFSLINGGSFLYRPVLINGWEVVQELRRVGGGNAPRPWWRIGAGLPKKGTLEIMNSIWLRQHAERANVDTLRFPDGRGLIAAPLKPIEDWYIIFLAAQLFGVFIYMPISFIVFPVGIVVLFLAISFYGPWDCFPSAFRRDWWTEVMMRYYSYKVVVEAPTTAYQGKTAIYTFGPHGVFGIAPAIQGIVHEMVTGDNFHMLGVSAIFKVPVYNAYCRMLGMKSIDRHTFKKTLLSGRSVGLLPGGIAEMFATNTDSEALVVKGRKGFVKLALETGAQIVPCYNFGNSQTFSIPSKSGVLESLSRRFRISLILFYGRWGLPIPYRTPLLTVIGRPILCPKVANPSSELINDYHERYLRETRRIYDSYKNTFNWQDRPLVFKR